MCYKHDTNAIESISQNDTHANDTSNLFRDHPHILYVIRIKNKNELPCQTTAVYETYLSESICRNDLAPINSQMKLDYSKTVELNCYI